MGFALAHVEMPLGERTDLIEMISERLRTEYSIRAGKSTLYQCARLYNALSGDYLKYLHWIETRTRALGRPVLWYDIVEDILGGRSNADVIGSEAAEELDYRDVERAMQAIENIIARAAGGNEEAVGVLEAYREALTSLAFLNKASSKTPRSSEYLRFVSSHGCLVCSGPSDAHHALGRRGKALKPSDYGAVPLCRRHHDELHREGSRTFELIHHVSLYETALNLLHRFVTGSWLTIELPRIDSGASAA